MKYVVVASSEWAYPDILKYATASEAIILNTARNAMPSAQLLLPGVPKGAKVQIQTGGGIADLQIEMYEMVPVYVESTVGLERVADLSDPGRPRPLKGCPSRFAPFYVYDCIKPLEGALDPIGGTAGLYFCFKIPTDQDAGKIAGTITVSVNGASAVIPVAINVYPAAIPKEEHLKIVNSVNALSVAAYHHLEPGSDAHRQMFFSYLKMFRRMKQNMTRASLTPPVVTQTGPDAYAFDFSEMVKQIKEMSALGYQYFGLFLGRRRSWKESTIYVNDLPAMSYEGYVYLSQYLTALNDLIVKNGWQGRIITSIADEPNEKNATEFRALCGLTRKLAPDLVLYDAVSYVPIHGALDIWVPLNSEYDKHRGEFESFRGKGDELWHYTCCGPRGEGYINRFTDYPLLSTRYLFWGNYAYDLTGFLHWGGNSYQPGQDPYTCSCPMHTNADSGSQLPAGDTHIVYPGKNGPLASMRLEAHRLSAEDYELLLLLSKKDKQAADRICAACFRSFNDVEYDPIAFEGARVALLTALSES